MAEYGKYIKVARERAGLTQEQLGDKIGVTGVTIMRYEKNLRQPRLEQIQAIAHALNVSQLELTTGITEEEWIAAHEAEWADYESTNKGRLFFNFVCQHPLLIDVLSSASISLHMDKDGKIIATFDEYEEKEIFLSDLERFADVLSDNILKSIKDTLGLPFDEDTEKPSEE